MRRCFPMRYAAEALYYRGVSRYKASHEVSALKEDWTDLQRRFPGSEWATKADVL
jgi:hypothetical protein